MLGPGYTKHGSTSLQRYLNGPWKGRERLRFAKWMLVLLCWLVWVGEGRTEPVISADAAVLMEAETGTILWSRNPDQRRAPASTTKIITGILGLELGNLDQQVKVSARAAAVGQASVHLEAGEIFTLLDLIKGALIRSGNDATVAIAEDVGGTVEYFVALMNQKVRLLGAANSNFVNTHGLPAEQHFSTARDLAMVARYALHNPEFAEIVATKETSIGGSAGTWVRQIRNTNRLLFGYPGADGVKTGTTFKAGQCLVASATRGSTHLIAVVLHSDNRWGDAARLLDWGFDNFTTYVYPAGYLAGDVAVTGGEETSVPVITRRQLVAVVARELQAGLELRLDPISPAAPISQGQELGVLQLGIGSDTLDQVPVIAVRDVKHQAWYRRWVD